MASGRPSARRRGACPVRRGAARTAAAGCISEPSGGPVISYSMTQGPGGQSQPLPQIIAQPPPAGWSPEQIVTGFLAASASFAGGQRIAREYLTTKENRAWTPNWSAVVYSSGPNVRPAAFTGTGSGRVAKTVTVGRLGAGVPFRDRRLPWPPPPPRRESARRAADFPPAEGGQPVADLQRAPVPGAHELLVPVRLSAAEPVLLRSHHSYLVPDPVYVPLQATTASLMDGLVYDLINPPGDWLSRGATSTSFPGRRPRSATSR